jgi:hypothetical protein
MKKNKGLSSNIVGAGFKVVVDNLILNVKFM